MRESGRGTVRRIAIGNATATEIGTAIGIGIVIVIETPIGREITIGRSAQTQAGHTYALIVTVTIEADPELGLNDQK